MSNEQIIEIFFDMRQQHKLTHKQHEALAWAVAKLMAGDFVERRP